VLANAILDLPIAVPAARDVVIAILNAAPTHAVQPAATVAAARRRMREQTAPRRIARQPRVRRRFARARRRRSTRADGRRIRRELVRQPHHVRRLAQRVERLRRIEDRIAARRAHQTAGTALIVVVIARVDALEAFDETGPARRMSARHRHRPRVRVEADGTGQSGLELVEQLLLRPGELDGQLGRSATDAP